MAVEFRLLSCRSAMPSRRLKRHILLLRYGVRKRAHSTDYQFGTGGLECIRAGETPALLRLVPNPILRCLYWVIRVVLERA